MNWQRLTSYLTIYVLDWAIAIAGFTAMSYLELNIPPFYRHFSLNDETIQFPYVANEQVSTGKLAILAVVLPMAVITVTVLFKLRYLKSNSAFCETLHFGHISLLALMISLGITGVITEFLKVMIGKPRPDFIARCGPSAFDTKIVDRTICTQPFGFAVLKEGFKSSPSGHSSFAFCGLGFLSLWISGVFKEKKRVAVKILPALPILLAIYIALTRTQDYKHHFKDIFLGSAIGGSITGIVFHFFFHPAWSENVGQAISQDYKVLLDDFIV